MRLILLLISFFAIFSNHAFAQSLSTSHITRLHIPVSNATIKLEKQANIETKKILVSDNLSSTKAIITESGELSDIPTYYPYGSSTQQIKASETARQYTGQRKVLNDSSVYNYNARYYNPTTAIFIQPDNIEGPNRFAYVAGNPIMANDPTGNVISTNRFLPQSDHPSDPTPCSTNYASCIGSRLNYHTGILSALAFLTPDRSSDWLDQEVKEERNYISSSEDLSANAISSAVGVAGIFSVKGPKMAVDTFDYANEISHSKRIQHLRSNIEKLGGDPLSEWERGYVSGNRRSSTSARAIAAQIRSRISRGYIRSALEEGDQIAALVKQAMPYRDDLALLADKAGEGNHTLIIRNGGGICRHNARLCTDVMDQVGGWQTRPVTLGFTDTREGHAVVWGYKDGQHLILDPSMGGALSTQDYLRNSPTSVDYIYLSRSTKKWVPMPGMR